MCMVLQMISSVYLHWKLPASAHNFRHLLSIPFFFAYTNTHHVLIGCLHRSKNYTIQATSNSLNSRIVESINISGQSDGSWNTACAALLCYWFSGPARKMCAGELVVLLNIHSLTPYLNDKSCLFVFCGKVWRCHWEWPPISSHQHNNNETSGELGMLTLFSKWCWCFGWIYSAGNLSL